VSFAEGEQVVVTAGPSGLRFLLVSGETIGEPIARRGPIVMNTQAELRTAFDELERGTFIKHAKKGRQ
jgi:redox-sensitive bicupin YhaK (pirin superfamily)